MVRRHSSWRILRVFPTTFDMSCNIPSWCCKFAHYPLVPFIYPLVGVTSLHSSLSGLVEFCAFLFQFIHASLVYTCIHKHCILCVLTDHPKKDAFVIVKYFSTVYFVNISVSCPTPFLLHVPQQLHTLR